MPHLKLGCIWWKVSIGIPSSSTILQSNCPAKTFGRGCGVNLKVAQNGLSHRLLRVLCILFGQGEDRENT